MIIVQISESDLKTMISDAVRDALLGHIGSEVKKDEPLIKGILGLSKYLNISHSHAQKLKNSGMFPYSQTDRLIYFDPAKVREIATVNKLYERRKK